MTHLSLAVIILSILAFAVGFIFGVVFTAEKDLHIPLTNFDKFVQVNREELLIKIANEYCINPITFEHGVRDCTQCPFGEYSKCTTNTEEWLRRPYID